jgi:DegV family protein with EDD domain
MKKISILVGESASLTPEIIEKYDFVPIPFKLIWEEAENIEGSSIFEKMRKISQEKTLKGPKTSQPSIGVYKKTFEEALETAENVLYICLSSKLSGAYNSATQAYKILTPENQKRVFIFNSFSADSSETMVAIKARELANEGLEIQEIIEKLDALKDQVKLFASIETPIWLEAGGRLPHALSIMVEQMQKIGMRPILMLKEGEIKPAMLKTQAKDPATAVFKTLEDISKEILSKGKTCRAIITHGDSIEEAKKLEQEIKEKYGDKINIEFIGNIGPVIGAHVGPGALMCCLLENA